MLQYLICRDPFHVLLDHAKDWYEKPKIHFHPQFAQRLQNKTGAVCIDEKIHTYMYNVVLKKKIIA